MNTIIRVAAAVNRVKVADCAFSYERIMELLDTLKEKPADLVVLPSLALTSPSCGMLFQNQALLDRCKEIVDNICILTQDIASYVIMGTPVEDNGKVVSAMAVMYKGELVGYVQGQQDTAGFLSTDYSQKMLPATTVFSGGGLKFCILSCDPLSLTQRAGEIAKTGCDLIVVPSYAPAMAGYYHEVQNIAQAVSKSYGCAVMVVNGGLGDTTAPYLYRGFAMLHECGRMLMEKVFDQQEVIMCDLDCDIIRANKTSSGQDLPYFIASACNGKQKLLRPIPINPYLPENPLRAQEYLQELFTLQCLALKGRLENTGIQKVVLGVSGGLDSTLALLVAAKTMDLLGRDRSNIYGLILPGMGTGERTHQNAQKLCEMLEVYTEEISIEPAVKQHFSDIGHDPAVKDVTYENAQARERTQILFDYANKEGALVVGTGDLSEIALGWCTFGGDHLSGFNVNASLTKTLVKKIVQQIAHNDVFQGAAPILLDVADTPISPELLRNSDSEITQKTEELLGPYELHEFFLYHMLKYGFRPSKIYYYGCFAFRGILEPAFIKEKLELFLRRFFASQFKRSCHADSAILCDAVFGNYFYLPSDLSVDMYIEELKSASF